MTRWGVCEYGKASNDVATVTGCILGTNYIAPRHCRTSKSSAHTYPFFFVVEEIFRFFQINFRIAHTRAHPYIHSK